MIMTVYGMVTTQPSQIYTPYALSSFFQATPFGPDDRFFLIDNDGVLTRYPQPADRRVTTIRNPCPVCFSANVNQIMPLSRAAHADLIFLNNDLIFPPGWLAPMLAKPRALLSPVSNFQCPYRTPTWDCAPFMDLENYLGHEDDFANVARAHPASVHGYQRVLKVPFFCIKIPYEIQVTVGELDERLKGGAEDDDYTLRCHRVGFPVMLALGSYVLHFQGKSTWRGVETPAQSRQREQEFMKAFQAKWGRRLLEVMILGRPDPLQANPRWWQEWQQGNYRSVIEQLIQTEEAERATAGARKPPSPAACQYVW
jgi:hypothetical protein